MSHLGQSRQFGRVPTTSALPLRTDIVTAPRHVSKVPRTEVLKYLKTSKSTFRVDRIQPPLSTGLRFTARQPPEGDFAAYVSRSVMYSPYPHQLHVILHASVEQAAERVPPAAGTLEALGDDKCVLHTGDSSLDALAVHLALLGFDFEVREPAELAERIRGLAARLSRACAANG